MIYCSLSLETIGFTFFFFHYIILNISSNIYKELMELAILLIALGGLYFASKNERSSDSNTEEEGFVSNSAVSGPTQYNETLPNVDIPNS